MGIDPLAVLGREPPNAEERKVRGCIRRIERLEGSTPPNGIANLNRCPENFGKRLQDVIEVVRINVPDLHVEVGWILKAASSLVVLHPTIRPRDRVAANSSLAHEPLPSIQIDELHAAYAFLAITVFRLKKSLPNPGSSEQVGTVSVPNEKLELADAHVKARTTAHDENT
ncbi:MAG TPA: hypothetical protein VGY58_06205, partial [Gemmataceae bacterium]|nr:hypothetical protein [Gemmataceae bacterium]